MPSRLYINHIADFDWLIALEFGRVDDGQPAENWRGVSEQFGFLNDGPDGPCVGFKIVDFSEFDPDDPEVAEIWGEPRFDVPVLGLSSASAGEIVLATRALFGPENSINRQFFHAAMDATGEEALNLWLAALQAGDAMAHFGVGYTLFDLERYPEAYRHLRHYTEIAAAGSWNWCWLGQAAEKVGEVDEARAAYTRALELERELGEGHKTDAAEFLVAIGARIVNYWDYNKHAKLVCPSCPWSGTAAGHEQYFEELFDICCPDCERMLLIVSYPTAEETRAAAAAGSEAAQAELGPVDEREARFARADEVKLSRAEDLPKIPGFRKIHIDWDLEEDADGEHWTVLRHGDMVLWRELAFWQGYERFGEVFEMLRTCYGSRLAEVSPTPESETYLYGDRLSAPRIVESLNASLRVASEPLRHRLD